MFCVECLAPQVRAIASGHLIRLIPINVWDDSYVVLKHAYIERYPIARYNLAELSKGTDQIKIYKKKSRQNRHENA